ncbi:DUF169 domain-containing protein [Sporosarcina sp. G11-34]|uniref:DUF169 domain-containing protein n=1 Tax=Sporosarcina sp. G11-34 TaxID=2849605 RepID=UPI0022A921CF|nr:DUF169 domain-containing protein [Sporosarcina sp. G11-34]MCZ2258278.1 DUF169 domain-containing protein [Sporosarcina sp. G11-34]
MVKQVEVIEWKNVVDDLFQLLRIKTIPIGMKMYESKEDMEAIAKIRRPTKVHTTDQIVAQGARLGWTVGITAEDLVMPQCGAVIGLHKQDEEWLDGEPMAGVWFETKEDARAHQEAMHVVPYGQYEAMAVSPLVSGRIDNPDICLIYGTPGQIMILINGLQWSGYKNLNWGVVGESSCADSWGRALKTKEPSLSIPCYAERRYGGVLDEEMLMAIPPSHLVKAIEGMKKLSKNGLRYPIAQYGIQQDAQEGLGFSYNKK